MAEYMDIARIDDWNDLSIIDDNGYVTFVYDVGELPRADVVEREKIDKAIKIAKDSISECFELSLDERAFGMQEILNIFEENIGKLESEDER